MAQKKNTVLQTLSKEIDDFLLFQQVFDPGVVYASINWKGVLGRSAEVAAIATLLWQIYVDKVEPKINQVEQRQPVFLVTQVSEFKLATIRQSITVSHTPTVR